MAETVKQGVWDKEAYVLSLLIQDARYHRVPVLTETQVKSRLFPEAENKKNVRVCQQQLDLFGEQWTPEGE